MKYMCEYTIRTAGLSFDQNIAGGEALLTAFSKWKPEEEKRPRRSRCCFRASLEAAGFIAG